MKRTFIIGGIAGIVLILALLAYSGMADVMHMAMRVGWLGLLLMILTRCTLLIPCALAWWLLSSRRMRWSVFILASWVRAAMGELFITPPLGSEAAGMRILTNGGMCMADAAACTVVDLTIDLGSQVAFAITGLMLLSISTPDSPWLLPGLIVSALAAAATAGFALAQKGGLFHRLGDWMSRWNSGWLGAMRLSMQDAHEQITAIYHRPGYLFGSFFLQYGAWMIGVIPTWIGLSFLGHPLAWHQVIAMDAMVFAIRGAAFMMPAGIGAQEGAYMLLGQLFGLDPASALALSLLRRTVDWLATFPALLVWPVREGKRLRKGYRAVQE